MKTNNLSKKSFLTSLIIMMSAGFAAMKNSGGEKASTPNGYIGGGSPIFIPRRGKLKGYMKENRKCSFNKNK